jgi:hypothetical protein
MNTKILLWPAAALLTLSSLSAQAVPSLWEYGINLDGDYVFGDEFSPVAPLGVDISGFDTATGLGTITATVTGAGSHNFAAYFDHELGTNVTNERGLAVGSPDDGQSWGIDVSPWDPVAPGFIDFDMIDLALLNSRNSPDNEDVALALGWEDFHVGGTGTVTITLLLSEVAPSSGFYLKQGNGRNLSDPIYLSSTIAGATFGQVPEPSILALMGLGLAGMVVSRRKDRV